MENIATYSKTAENMTRFNKDAVKSGNAAAEQQALAAAKEVSESNTDTSADAGQKQSSSSTPRKDTFEMQTKQAPAGTYHVEKGADGSKSIVLDGTDSQKSDAATAKLQKKKTEIEKQIKAAADDPVKKAELQKKLAQIKLQIGNK